MSKLTAKIVPFLLVTGYYLLFTISSFAAEPGLNLINNPASLGLVPQRETFNWLLFTPGSPDELTDWTTPVDNIVIRIHSEWTPIGKLMLGMPSQQQQAANNWCGALNSIQNKRVFVQPFNELEHDYARQSTTGTLSLNTAIIRANVFIGYLRSCLSSTITITSPALEPQSADFPTTSAAFSNFDVISCMPYRLDTIDRCVQVAAGKPLIFTEIGVDKNGVKYEDCQFTQSFCDEGFIQKVQNTPNLIAYFLFTFAPGNFDGFWQLTNNQVVNALKNDCNNVTLKCDKTTDKTIDDIVQSVKNNSALSKTPPLPARGISSGPTYFSDVNFFDRIKSLFGWLNILLSRQGGQQFPFNFRNEQYVEDVYTMSGQMDTDMVKLIQPTTEVLDRLATIIQGSTSTDFTINQANKIENYTSAEYKYAIEKYGPGEMFSVDADHLDFFTEEGQSASKKAFTTELKTGILPRITSGKYLTDTQVDKTLCQLAASADPGNPFFQANPEKRLFDEVLGYLAPVKDENFIYLLPVGGDRQVIALPDRTRIENNGKPVPIMISTIFCINPNLASFLTKCSGMGYGSISPNVCANSAPNWLKQPALEGPIFRTFYPRLRYHSLILEQNASAKAFVERCQEQPDTECVDNQNTYSSDFGDLSVDNRTTILNIHNGAFNKSKAALCYACKVDIFFLTNLTKANQAVTHVSKWATPYSLHDNLTQVPSSVKFSKNDIKQSGVNTPDHTTPLGIVNTESKYDYRTASYFADLIRSVFSRVINYSACILSYTPDEQGNNVPNQACLAEKKSKLETIVYMPSSAFEFVNADNNLTNSLLPYSAQQKIDTSIENATGGHSKVLSTIFQVGYETGNQHSGLEDAKTMYTNNRTSSAEESYDRSAEEVGGPQNTVVKETVTNLYFTPYSWQNLSNQDSTQYDSRRPSDGSSPSADFNPDVLNYCDTIKQSAQTYNLEPSLIAALISIESDGNPDARSNCGAIGLMQVMPNDPQKYGGEPCLSKFDPSIFVNRPSSDQLFNPQYNIQYGTKLLSGMISYWGGLEAGLTHYGPTGYDGYANLVLNVQSQNPTACSP